MNQALPVQNTSLSALVEQLISIEQIIKYPEIAAIVQEGKQLATSSHAAHMTSHLAPYSYAGMQIAAMHQGNLLSAEHYPELLHAEQQIQAWLQQFIPFSHVHFMHSGSFANLQALWQARQSEITNSDVVYGSDSCHYSIHKACDLLGLKFVAIETDNQDRVITDKLAEACQNVPPLAIVANLGSSALGAVDDLSFISQLTQDISCWLHIDAAWGGAKLFLPESDLEVVITANSLTVDPHKSLFQPRPCSLFFCQTPTESITDIDYLDTAPKQLVSGSYGSELFIPLWLNWKMLGEEWFIEKTRYRLLQAEHFAKMLEGFAINNLIHHGTGIVCFQSDNTAKLDKLVELGQISKVRRQQQDWYRIVFTSHTKTADDLIKAIQPFL